MIKQHWLDMLLTVFNSFFMKHQTGHLLLEDSCREWIEEGYNPNEVEALLESLPVYMESILSRLASHGERSLRIFSDYERQILDADVTGTLYALEQHGLINPLVREELVDAMLMQAEGVAVNPGEFKYLVYHHLAELLPETSHFGLQYVLFDRNKPQVLQ